MLRRLALILVLAACSSTSPAPTTGSTTSTTSTTSATSTSSTALPAGTPELTPVPIGLRIDRRVDDAATSDFSAVVEATLVDARGWLQAGFAFSFGDNSPFTVVLAESDVVDALCLPYDTYGLYSCQNGPVVALSADRWRTATPEWTGTLPEYRQMLVNHEVGHLLGQHHPSVQCPGVGEPAPVMAQQSTELKGCLPNPWPLPWEIDCAAQHIEPLAPGYEPDAQPICGPGRSDG